MNAKSEQRPFAFFAGDPALDLPGTLSGRLKSVQHEALASPADLGRWFVQAGLASRAPRTTTADLALARALREGIYAAALARIGGAPLPAHAVAVLNRLAAGKPSAPRIDARGRVHRIESARTLLVDLARAAIRRLAIDAPDRVRQCEGESCARLFVDASRLGERRWCSMAACGNRAKVAEFRRRRKG